MVSGAAHGIGASWGSSSRDYFLELPDPANHPVFTSAAL